MSKVFSFKKPFVIFSLIVLIFVSIAGVVIALTSYRVAPGAEVTVNEHGICKKVTNNSGKEVFVPTKVPLEWELFRSNAINVTIVDCLPSGYPCGTATVIDADNNVYNTVQIGTQCWMKQNLRTGSMVLGSVDQKNDSVIEKYCDNDEPSRCLTEGGLYQWGEMLAYNFVPGIRQGICPAGWHVPSDAEWYTLESGLSSGTCDPNRNGSWDCTPAGTKLLMGGSSGFDGVAVNNMVYFDGSGDQQHYKVPKLTGGNTMGILSFGSMTSSQLSGGALFNGSIMWSSSKDGSNAWYRVLQVGNSDTYRHPDNFKWGYFVRCLKD